MCKDIGGHCSSEEQGTSRRSICQQACMGRWAAVRRQVGHLNARSVRKLDGTHAAGPAIEVRGLSGAKDGCAPVSEALATGEALRAGRDLVEIATGAIEFLQHWPLTVEGGSLHSSCNHPLVVAYSCSCVQATTICQPRLHCALPPCQPSQLPNVDWFVGCMTAIRLQASAEWSQRQCCLVQKAASTAQ